MLEKFPAGATRAAFPASCKVKGGFQYTAGKVIGLTDEALIELYFARSEGTVSVTREVYGPCCQAISLGILGDEQDAEECLADMWLWAWNSLPPQRAA